MPVWGKVSIAAAVLPVVWKIVSAIFGLVSRKELLAAIGGQERRRAIRTSCGRTVTSSLIRYCTPTRHRAHGLHSATLPFTS
jgi:hypothetical protein